LKEELSERGKKRLKLRGRDFEKVNEKKKLNCENIICRVVQAIPGHLSTLCDEQTPML